LDSSEIAFYSIAVVIARKARISLIRDYLVHHPVLAPIGVPEFMILQVLKFMKRLKY